MQVLYKDEEGFLAVMEVTKAAYKIGRAHV